MQKLYNCEYVCEADCNQSSENDLYLPSSMSVEPGWRNQIYSPWPNLSVSFFPWAFFPNMDSEDCHCECFTYYIGVYKNEIKVILLERNFMKSDILGFIVGFQIIICPKAQKLFKG